MVAFDSYKVGAPLQEATAVLDQAAGASAVPTASKPTAIFLPPSKPAGQSAAATSPGSASCSPEGQVVSLSPILSNALIPVALVVAGLGLAILNRIRRTLPKARMQAGKQPAQNGDSNSKEGHG